MSPAFTASANREMLAPSTKALSFGQLANPYARAVTLCASIREKVALSGLCSYWFTSAMATRTPDRYCCKRSLACLRSCSRFGRSGKRREGARLERVPDMTILLWVTARCPRVGLKKIRLRLSASEFTGGLSPIRGHGGVRYAASIITRLRSLRGKYPAVNYIRYANDSVITGKAKELLEGEIKPLVEQFLRERGLELFPKKTVVTQVKQGFDFLGQNLRSRTGQRGPSPRGSTMSGGRAKLGVRRERNAPEIGCDAVLLDKLDGVGGNALGRFQLSDDPRRNLATVLVSQLHDGANRKVTSQLHSRSVLVEIGGAAGHGK